MSEPSETGGRPLASSLHQPEGSPPSTTTHRRRRRTSQSSDERVGGTKSVSSSRRRLGTRTESYGAPATGSSRGDSSTMQRSASPRQMSPENPVHYTRTGRISKAKKGLKVHHCDCGRSYTRAEHLRRHQKNHAPDALRCEFPGCGKPFFRPDLLQRHQEKHNDGGKDSPQPSMFSPGSTAEPESHVSATVALPTPIVTTQPPPFYQPVSPMPESATDARYTSNPFRTPRMPSSTLGHDLRSSSFSSPTSSFNHMKQHRSSFPARQTSVTIPVPVDGVQAANLPWNDSYTASPNNSCSSGYASPIPGTGAGDFANMFANPPYGPSSNRTRTSSNASFIEPQWTYPSRSPTSATSTMAFTWTSNDKSPAPPGLAYMATSYPMMGMPMSAGVDPIAGFGHFGPKSMAQRDEEEQSFLFEQSYGMGQTAHIYPSEQYLDNFWRHFHPAFPVVHRTSFERVSQSPMLHAAMIAIGGQYSNDASVKRKSRLLHDRCVKLLDKRVLDVMTEDERLCDWQASFLIEVLSQYRARRAAKNLSSRFETMYQKFAENFRIVSSGIGDIVTALVHPENVTYDRWVQWVELSTQQRLLQCCYILESQQATLLARNPQPSLIQGSGFDLPFPSHSSLWEATNLVDWAMNAQQHAHYPAYVYQISADMVSPVFDSFQSSLVIATYYNHFNNTAPYLAPPQFAAIDHLLDSSAITKHQILSAKLLQLVPARALLAVSGESWILSEKVPSAQAFQNYKSTLRTWMKELWTSTDSQDPPVKAALKVSIDILQHAIMTSPHALRLEFGADMGLYFAALVIWAVTVAANTRINAPQQQAQGHRYQSHSPLPSSCNFPSTPTHLSAGTPGTSPNPSHPSALGLTPNPVPSPAPPSPAPASMQYSEMVMHSMDFLSNALLELNFLGIVPQWPRDVAQWQQGCEALMRWVKMRLRNGAMEARDSVIAAGLNVGLTSAGSGKGGDSFGELLDGIIAVLEKVLGRGWEGWSV